MSLRINQNIAAMNAYRNLSVTDSQMSKSLEKLSSGYRINRAADDAAGLSISEGLRAQIGGLKTAVNNAQDGISVVQTAEGALTETHSILQRMRDLAVRASSGGSQNTSAQDAANAEFGQLKIELDRIANTTSFGTQKLLDGSYGLTNQVTSTAALYSAVASTSQAISFDINLNGNSTATTITATGTNATVETDPNQLALDLTSAIRTQLIAAGGTGNEVTLTSSTDPVNGTAFTLSAQSSLANIDVTGATALTGMAATTGAVAGSSGVFQVGANNQANERISVSITKQDSATLGLTTSNLSSTLNAQAAITQIDSAIASVSSTRANLGAYQNRFEHAVNNLNVAVENLSASESRIRDTDMAQEMVQFTRSQILSQAGTAMLAQANSAPQSVLKLLQ